MKEWRRGKRGEGEEEGVEMGQERRKGGERGEEHAEMVGGERGRGGEGREEEEEREGGMGQVAAAQEDGGDERRGGGERGGEGAEVRGEVLVRGPVVRECTADGVGQVLIGREEARETEASIADQVLNAHFCRAALLFYDPILCFELYPGLG